jgi:hypothetical protein
MNTITNTNTTGFEIETCSRCGGSGQYSYCQTHGTRCFKCGGGKVVLTKRGAAARAKYFELISKKTKDIKVGDSVLTEIGLGAKKFWHKVKAISPYPAMANCVMVDLVRGVKEQCIIINPESHLYSVSTEEERKAALEEALAYQTTLLKTGKVGKERKLKAA